MFDFKTETHTHKLTQIRSNSRLLIQEMITVKKKSKRERALVCACLNDLQNANRTKRINDDKVQMCLRRLFKKN